MVLDRQLGDDRNQKLQREIYILKVVDHPHIIILNKIYESPKNIYLVMEVCPEVLADVFKNSKPFSEDNARKVISELASAVAYLHRNGSVFSNR